MDLDDNWTPALVAYLRSVTRELKFDWNEVAVKVREFADQENIRDATITPSSCRKWFASDYHVNVAGTAVSDEKGEIAMEDVQPSHGMENLMKDYESMSMDELVAHVEATELQMKQRKEEIFGRVLTSLGGGTSNIESTVAFNAANNTTTTTSYSDYELTRQAYADNLAIKEAERLKKVAFIEEQAEKARLEKERDTLKRRFEEGSADGEGEDPLAHVNADGVGAGFKYGDSSSVRAAGEKLSPEMEFIDSMPYDPNVTQALENFMETDEFEVMLSELEREIDAMAPGKAESEPPSELSEILRVLETAAAANTARSESKRAAPIVLPPSPPRDNSADLAAPVRRAPARAAPLDSVASGKDTQSGKMGADITSSTASAPVQTKAPLSAADFHAVEQHEERVAPKELQYGSRRGQASAEVVRTDSVSEDEEVHSEGSDSEDDWRSMRNKQKKTADRVRPTASAAARATPSKPAAPAERPARGAPGTSFWGAYGGAPTVRNTVRSNADAAATTEEVEDVRFNSAIAEYAQSVGLSLNRADSDDESGSEDGQPAGLAESPVTPQDTRSSVRIEIIESSESEDEAPTRNLWFKEPISSALEPMPSPPKQAQQDSSPSAVTPPSPPAQSFTPLSSVAPPVPVQAASGLLGGAGARRAKGKTGSIMSAARPRKGGAEEAPTAAAESTPEEVPIVQVVVAASVPSARVPPSVVETAVVPPVVVAAVEEPVVEVVVSAAEIVAAQVQRAIALDKIIAPVLSPLPYAYISNKASGSVAEFSVASLPAKFESAGGSVERAVLVDVNIAALRALTHFVDGDVAWVAVVAWLLEVAGPNFAVLGMQCGTSESLDLVCRLVLETSSDRVTDADLIYLCKSTPLSYLVHLPAAAEGTTSEPTVADVLHIRDAMTAPLMSDLQFFSQPLSNEVLMPHLQCAVANADLESPVILAHARDIAVCAIKSHVLSGQHLLSASAVGTSSTVLTALVAQAECAGLRLCGMRLVHLSALELFEYESMCSIPAYTRPVAPQEPSHNHAFNAHILPVLCLAFHSSTSLPSDHGSQPATSTTAKNAINTNPHSAANVLRTLLGPEDPALARKTDPQSLRALYATSKEHNLAYPLAHSVDRLYKETAFWFGGRAAAVAGAVEPKKLALLRVGSPQRVQIGVSVEADRGALDASSAGQLSSLQIAALRSVCERFDDLGQLVSFNCLGSVAAYRAALKGSVQHVATAHTSATVAADGEEAVTDSVSSLQLLWTFESHVAEAYLAHSAAAIQAKVASTGAALNSAWRVEVSWATHAATSSADQASAPESHLSGSRLLALEMLKKVGEDDVKSHEDVGLPDVVVITVGNAQHPEHHAPGESPVSVLSSVLAILPRTCEATLIAAKAVHHGAGLSAVLRGYQVLENIDYAVAEVQRIAGGGGSPGKGAVAKPVTATKTGAKVASAVHDSLFDTLKIHRGKRALEMIFTEFPLTSIYTDLAVRDLHTYVPLPGLQLTGLNWHAQAAAVSASAVYSSSQLTTLSAQSGSQVDALLSTPAQYLQALYPPGVFTAVGVLVVPWTHDGAVMTRNIARILSRLEKDNFAVLEVKAVKALSKELIDTLYRENCGEYASFAKNISGTTQASSVQSEASIIETVAAAVSQSAVVILVRRRSALLQLKSTIGPVFSAEIAETQYPRSLVCLLNSLGGVKAKVSAVPEVPLILSTLSCASAQGALQEVFPHFHANHKVQMAALSLNALSEASLVGVSDSANIEHVEERLEGTGEVNGLAVQVPSSARINTIAHGTAPTDTASGELHMISDGTVRHVDIAGVVVTHALLQEVGLGLLLEALHREGLVLRNVYTTHVTMPAAKQLQQLAGASSLSMKPPAALITHAPLLVLGVEGPSHSFVRFKSFSLLARSAAQLWKLTGHSVHEEESHRGGIVEARAHLGAHSATTVAGEWGVLASSSTRLAKDLYKHCFGEIFGEDSVFTYA